MSEADWSAIPGRLRDAGFAVCYDRVSYEPARPLWCAKASRDGREWITVGKNLCAAFQELERQTHDSAGDWRGILAHEAREPAHGAGAA